MENLLRDRFALRKVALRGSAEERAVSAVVQLLGCVMLRTSAESESTAIVTVILLALFEVNWHMLRKVSGEARLFMML